MDAITHLLSTRFVPSLSEISGLSFMAFIGFFIDTVIAIIISIGKSLSFLSSTLLSLGMPLVRQLKPVFVTRNN